MKTIAVSLSSQASITSASRFDPPGWITVVAPASMAAWVTSHMKSYSVRPASSRLNSTSSTMERAMLEFSTRLDAETTALFYYAGHGVQSRGRNYLLPVNARIDSEAALRFEAVDIGALIEEIGLARSGSKRSARRQRLTYTSCKASSASFRSPKIR